MLRLFRFILNNRGEVAAAGVKLTPEQEITQLRKDLEASKGETASHAKQVKTLSAHKNAWDKMRNDLGNVIDYDPETGYPVRVVVDDPEPPKPSGAVTPPAGAVTAHPFKTILGDDHDFAPVDKYYDERFVKSDKLSSLVEPLAKKYGLAYAQQAVDAIRADNRMARSVNKLLSTEEFKGLRDFGSDYAKRVAQYLADRKIGAPLGENPEGFDDYRYADVGSLRIAADVVGAQIIKETSTKAAGDAEAAGKAGDAGLSAAPPGGGTAPPAGSEDWKADADKGTLEDRMAQEMTESMKVR